MRTLITISFLFFAFTASFSQEMAMVSTTEVNLNEPSTNKEARVAIAKMHTGSAVNQIAHYLAENVIYPDDMEEQSINGVVILEIKLNQFGKIKHTKVVESRSKQFEESVQAAMSKMGKVKIDGAFYYGTRKFQVPIQFSIDK